MKFCHLIIIILLAMSLSGCLIVRGHSFSMDYDIGTVELTYHDFRSVQRADEGDDSFSEDWDRLKESLAESYDKSDVHSFLGKKMFQEGDTLSANMKLLINCPACFSTKQALLEYVHRDGLYFEDIKEGRFDTNNGEILFFIPPGTTVSSTNGKVLKTEKNQIIVWPEEATNFEYKLLSTRDTYGKSLLTLYLAEQNNQD